MQAGCSVGKIRVGMAGVIGEAGEELQADKKARIKMMERSLCMLLGWDDGFLFFDRLLELFEGGHPGNRVDEV
jgi:hypothetical protein